MRKLVLILICLCSLQLSAQKPQADKKFKLFEYSEAIPLYKQYLDKNPADYEALKNLSLSYRFTNNISGAVESYRSLLKLKEAIPDDWYDLVQLLRISGDLVAAKQYALQYQQKNDSEKAKNLLKSIEMFDEFMSTKNRYDVINKTSQFEQSIYAPAYFKNGLIVTAEKTSGPKNEWTGRGFTKLYQTDASFNQLLPFASEIMSEYSDGIATFSTDEVTIYFTSINRKSIQEGDINTRKLQISSATFTDGNWILTDLFRFNNSNYNVAHPTLRSDGKMLVFSSNKPDGNGGMDLYYCTMQPDNTWSEPVNISILNTSENEIFPIFNATGDILFASNGLPGLGGLDLFISKNTGITFSTPVNLKAPINSNLDEFSLISNDNLESGYISTNRFGITETDDIAFFSKKEAPKPMVKPIVKITVQDKYTAIPLPYVSVTFKDDMNNMIFKGMTDPKGFILAEDLPKDNYKVQGILNDITTTIASIPKEEFSNELIERTLYHNDPRFTLSGVAVNAFDGSPVAGVEVTCENTVLKKSSTQPTSTDGSFFFQLEQSSDFKVTGQKKGWLSSEVAYETTKGLDRSKELYVKLKLLMQQPKQQAVIRLDKIYYDFNKYNINPRAAEELNRLIKLMKDFPDMTIELSSHTDSRGSDAYNLKLSQNRANAAVDYLVGHGISQNRMVAKGYGETKLLNDCRNGVDCTDAKHQENRRTEFTITACPTCPAAETR